MGSLDPGSTFFPFPGSSAPEERWTPDRVRHDEQGTKAWNRALAAWRRADAAIEAAAGTADQDHYDRLGDAHDRALVRLLRTPAPHAAALADKLDLLIAQQAWELSAADACLASLSADARRLAGA